MNFRDFSGPAFSGENRLAQVQSLRPRAANLAAWFEGIKLARHCGSIEVD
jgi:hypothetical protein